MENARRNILVAPLNWGLGHATRCIPIIRELEKNGFTPILASDGAALQILQKEFPHLLALKLPSYKIVYPKNGAGFKWKLITNSPNMSVAIFKENKIVNQWVSKYNLHGIISDNRLGIYSKEIPSVYLTHQLNILSGKTTWISSKIHQYFIKKFTQCWIPDVEKKPNLSGKLGHQKNTKLNLTYIGPLSRLEKKELPIKYDLMILLSGPEPQRSCLEQKLKNEISLFQGKVIFIKGIIETEQKIAKEGTVTYYNFMTSKDVETAINESKMVLCRSGYTTVMDLAKLQKKAFFIPTPGQYEQEYLARKLQRNGFASYAKQDDFKIADLKDVVLYQGLPQVKKEMDWKQLLILFKSE